MICAANPVEACASRAVSHDAPVEALASGCVTLPCADLPRIYAAVRVAAHGGRLVFVEDRNGEHYVPPGEAVLYTPADAAGGSLISWRAWREDLGEVGDMEADGERADAIAVRLGIYRGGPLACRLAVYRGVCALCETTAPAAVLEAA